MGNRALVTDADRIEAARLAADELADQMETANGLEGPSYTYADSVGGIVTYWPDRDPFRRYLPGRATNAEPEPGHTPAGAKGGTYAGGPSFAELDRLAPRPWR